MNRSKKIEVNASSLLDLKAELFRKQEEYKRHKQQSDAKGRPPPKEKKKNVWSKQNSGIKERSQKDIEEKAEEEDMLIKSRKALEAKTLLYDQMTKKMADDETSELYLVDFQRKVINNYNEKKSREETVTSQDKTNSDGESEKDVDEPDPSGPEEEWVDYVDLLGRSRRCLRKDLPYLQEVDRSLAKKETSVPDDTQAKWKKDNDLLSDDMRQEIERQEWEEEETNEVDRAEPVGPIHYQNVQHQEVRDHGIGYYAFSTEEVERRHQLEMLQNMRKQTENQKANREKLKDKRKALLQARLAKVQQRKNIVLPVDEESEEEKEEKEKELPILTETVITKEKPKTARPWDKGKVGMRNENFTKPKKMMTENDWINKQREERIGEFAPPSFYFNQSKGKSQNFRKRQVQEEEKAHESSSNTNNVTNIPLPSQEKDDATLEKEISQVLTYFRNKTS